MYEEMIKSLRICQNGLPSCEGCKYIKINSPTCANKLISEAADAIEKLEKLCDGIDADNDSLCEQIQELQKEVAFHKRNYQYMATAYEMATEPKWISVEDRLPDNNVPVIVYVPPHVKDSEEYFGYVGMANYVFSARGGFWCGTDGNIYGAIGIIYDPTHWMPLPEPPKTEETA